MKIEDIARICHEANRAYCLALGDDSHLPWADAPEAQRRSCIEGVQRHMVTPMSPEESHNAWLEHKMRNGWKYGPVKDEMNLEHPCIMPYHLLPPEQRAKDYIFGAIVRTVLAIDGERLGDGVAGDREAA